MSEAEQKQVNVGIAGTPTYIGSTDEAGAVYAFQCPMCHEEHRITERPWSPVVCACGYQWRIEVKVIGIKPKMVAPQDLDHFKRVWQDADE